MALSRALKGVCVSSGRRVAPAIRRMEVPSSASQPLSSSLPTPDSHSAGTTLPPRRFQARPRNTNNDNLVSPVNSISSDPSSPAPEGGLDTSFPLTKVTTDLAFPTTLLTLSSISHLLLKTNSPELVSHPSSNSNSFSNSNISTPRSTSHPLATLLHPIGPQED